MRSVMSATLILLLAAACIDVSPFDPGAPGRRPTIGRVQPVSAAVGEPVVITGSGFTPGDNALRVGAGYILKLPSSDSTTIRLTLPSYLGACPPGQEVCVALALPLAPGDYKLSVINAHGTSNEVDFRVVAR
jgi:hypothetical protein